MLTIFLITIFIILTLVCVVVALILKTIPSCHVSSLKSRAQDQSNELLLFSGVQIQGSRSEGKKKWDGGGGRESWDQRDLSNWPTAGIKYNLLTDLKDGQFIQGLDVYPNRVLIPCFRRAETSGVSTLWVGREGLGGTGLWCRQQKMRCCGFVLIENQEPLATAEAGCSWPEPTISIRKIIYYYRRRI